MSDHYINHNPKPEGKNPTVPSDSVEHTLDKLIQSSSTGKNAFASRKGAKGGKGSKGK